MDGNDFSNLNAEQKESRFAQLSPEEQREYNEWLDNVHEIHLFEGISDDRAHELYAQSMQKFDESCALQDCGI